MWLRGARPDRQHSPSGLWKAGWGRVLVDGCARLAGWRGRAMGLTDRLPAEGLTEVAQWALVALGEERGGEEVTYVRWMEKVR